VSRAPRGKAAAAVERDPFAPRANPALYGHADAERTLADAWASGRMHHAWLLTGPQGIGKATLAFRFARFVLSGGRGEAPGLFGEPPADPLRLDPADPVYQRIAAGGHADLLTIERTLNQKGDRMRTEIVVDDVRRVGGFMHHTSAEGGWRVVVVDSADQMNRNAANALLKVLEEPPARALLLLVCHNSGSLLPTIRSRCRTLALRPLPAEIVARILGERDPALAPEAARAIAAVAEGSAGFALALARDKGLDLLTALVDAVTTLPALDTARAYALGDRVSTQANDAAWRTLRYLLPWWLARMARTAGGAPPPPVLEGEAALMGRLAARGGAGPWLDAIETVDRLLDRTDAVALDRRQTVIAMFYAIQAAATRAAKSA